MRPLFCFKVIICAILALDSWRFRAIANHILPSGKQNKTVTTPDADATHTARASQQHHLLVRL